uniref:Xylanase inhibitor C-terminal domain-containing protein n=1 Tax=Oryza brachyantha TaxID=4533 RepID=J3L7N0_ORYBR
MHARAETLLLLVAISLLSVLPWHTLASGGGGGKPLVAAVTKDGSTSLYTVAVKDGRPLALDLSGLLVWSTCDASHSTIAATQNVAKKFALCLPSVAVFGGGPFVLIFPYWRPDITARLSYTALRRSPELGAGGYYITAKGITVNHQVHQQLALPNHGPLVVQLSSTIPYTELRPDVYGPFIKAWDSITEWPKKVTPPVAPFELCYDSRTLSSNRLGYAVPEIDINLEDGATWHIFGGNSLVQVDDSTACFAFVEMKPEKVGYGNDAPAVVIGGYQMEHNLVVFDEEKQQLGFSGLLFGLQTTCNNFNFTVAA